MSTRIITNVDKTGNKLESIIGLVGPDWGPLTLGEAIEWAKIPGNQFTVKGSISNLEVMVTPSKIMPDREILQTRTDPAMTDNLLALPAIPSLSSILGGRSIV